MPDDVTTLDAFHAAIASAFPPVPTGVWHARIDADMKAVDAVDRLVWDADDGLSLLPFYRRDDLQAVPPSIPAVPGKWYVRENISADSAAEANALGRRALAAGVTALGFGVAAPPLRGPRFTVSTQADIRRLLDGLPLSTTPVHIVTNGAFRPLVAMMANELERRRIDPAAFAGSISVDPLGLLLRWGRLHVSRAWVQLARLLTDMDAIGLSARALAADARPFHEAGATPAQEVACTLAATSEYLAALTERGIAADEVARRLHVTVSVGGSYLLEIARLRALRLLLPQVVRAFDAGAAVPPFFVTATTSRPLRTLYDPPLNLLRATTQAAAAVVGGCDEIVVYPHDAAARPAGDAAMRLARNIPLILRHEARLDAVSDPAAGSYYVETATRRLAEEAWSRFQDIESRGGLIECMRTGFLQSEIASSREARRDALARQERILVGINQYPDPAHDPERPAATVAAPPPPTRALAYPLTMETLQIVLRDGGSLDELGQPLPDEDALEAEPLRFYRWDEPFAALQSRTARFVADGAERPRVMLLPFGPPTWASARATFASSFFGCGGFVIDDPGVFASASEAAGGARDGTARIVVLCSDDASYPEAVSTVHEALAAAERPPLLVVAGPPGSVPDEASDRVHAFIHRRSDMPATLRGFMDHLDIPD